MRVPTLIIFALTRCLVDSLDVKNFVPSDGSAAEGAETDPPAVQQGQDAVPEQPPHDVVDHRENRAYDVIPPLEARAAGLSGESSEEDGHAVNPSAEGMPDSAKGSDERTSECKETESSHLKGTLASENKDIVQASADKDGDSEASATFLSELNTGSCAFRLSTEIIECALEADKAMKEAEEQVRKLTEDYKRSLTNTREICDTLLKVMDCHSEHCKDYSDITKQLVEFRERQTCRIEPDLLTFFRDIVGKMRNKETHSDFESIAKEFEDAVDEYVDGITQYSEIYKAGAYKTLSNAVNSMEKVREGLRKEAQKNAEMKALQVHVDMSIQVVISATDSLRTLLSKLLDF
ncbi:hypothetical protein BEWA_037090 [Theileria equi strain WA]|uniref:Signal peptide containing protein n=1 Tax=Theileria equi strain WA TaxID=1537102 RepID=L1LER6_THEEQ|nr:hypothetical protein BEWA_037090 [Theileria equi strain WA]EKX73673.1 hypothetical protein BEWA_037090 [Theileria equi strain WA]|eukprot:XP_004833125.1 hypothetical protein BEWA_037090 [Theileria equi strain WA]